MDAKKFNKKETLLSAKMAIEKLLSLEDDEVILEISVPVFMSSQEYAKTLGIEPKRLRERIKSGLYETPDGFKKKCYRFSGNNNSAVFNVELANEYYEINTINNN